jgi:crotonobetainyl-CoA:carnitine CoA-transferase CaiB-like acyl-CoA transferase
VKDYGAEELLTKAQTLRLPYGVVQWPDKLLEDEQLAARGYFVDVEHPELQRTFRYAAHRTCSTAPRGAYTGGPHCWVNTRLRF